MASFPEVVPNKFVVDAIHGDVHLTEREWKILDTPVFQRLRRLNQLGMGQMTYPNATHTRFAHSLGTLAIMARVLDAVNPDDFPLADHDRENLRLAALLHDIGHYPYSHLMERLDSVTLTEEEVTTGTQQLAAFDASKAKYPSHETFGTAILLNQEGLTELIGGETPAQEVAGLITRTQTDNAQLSKLVHSSLDMDRLDYLKRDSRAAGVPYGNIDMNYLLNALLISPTGMVGVDEKALPAAEQFLFARFFMHRVVYYHKTTYALEEACRQLLRRARDQGLYDIPADGDAVMEIAKSPKLLTFTDAFVDTVVNRASLEGDGVVQCLAKAVQNRRPPKLLKEVCILEDGAQQHHAGSAFWQRAKNCLKDLADSRNIDLGQFLLCRTGPLWLEKRGPLLTADQARGLPAETEDELIKVFVAGQDEPRSLVDIKHSLISQCAGKFFQSFRLYLVYEGNDLDEVVSRLRDEVRGWHLPA